MYNRVIVSGRLVSDPELKTGKVAYLRFTLAVNNPYARSQPTVFVPAIAWRNNAINMSKFLKRGSLVLVEAQLQNTQNNFVELSVNSVFFMESKKNTTNINPDIAASTSVEQTLPDQKFSSDKKEQNNIVDDLQSTSINTNNDASNIKTDTNISTDEKNNPNQHLENNNSSNKNNPSKDEGIDWDNI